jgi:hypothetical protein
MDKDESMEPVADAELSTPVEGKMMSDKKDMKKEAMHKDKDKKKMDEYKIQKSADTADHADNKKSPVASKNDMGGSAGNIAKGGADEKGRPAPTAQKTAGEFANAGGKDSRKMNPAKAADNADHSEKSAKSPITGK